MGFRKIFLIGCGVLENCFSWRAIVTCELFAGNWKEKGKEESKFGCKILIWEINMLARQHYQTVIDLQTKRIQTTNFLASISFLYIIFSCFSLHQHYPWISSSMTKITQTMFTSHLMHLLNDFWQLPLCRISGISWDVIRNAKGLMQAGSSALSPFVLAAHEKLG